MEKTKVEIKKADVNPIIEKETKLSSRVGVFNLSLRFLIGLIILFVQLKNNHRIFDMHPSNSGRRQTLLEGFRQIFVNKNLKISDSLLITFTQFKTKIYNKNLGVPPLYTNLAPA